MSRDFLGEFEQMVLLSIMRLGNSAYGLAISNELENVAGRLPSSGSLYTTLDRMEKKGLLESSAGEITQERGGRPRRYVSVTADGKALLARSRRLLVPPGSWLLEHPEMQPHLGPLDAASFSYQWKHPDSSLDALHPKVCRIVAEGARQGEDPALTFLRIRDLADSVGTGSSSRLEWTPRVAQHVKPPRLTEAWFC